ncbi:RHS repeat-associated core domain-containing protein, partial [Ralstonia solanacearum]|uniref:RHS repeat-associated core domain-containing protein n=1 Tax=Ralstonia solanacearum TaxID=305 RepID=UPI0009C1095A
NTLMVGGWKKADPFGATLPDENPTGLGTFTYNLRFPGQVYDQETGKHYNANRNYDPAGGRYIQSDPIGLYGGSPSTFAYVGSNPLTYIDAEGLAACTALFPDYPIDTGFGFTSTNLGGHGGVVTYDAVGSTRYYEYGRYAPSNQNVIGDKRPEAEGNVRRYPIPNLTMDRRTGEPNPDSLEALRKALSERVGHGTKVELTCSKDADEKKVNQFAEDFSKKKDRPLYSWKPWSSNQCRDFARRAVGAGER